eukprot:3537821-Prymnesium_polylepis.1
MCGLSDSWWRAGGGRGCRGAGWGGGRAMAAASGCGAGLSSSLLSWRASRTARAAAAWGRNMVGG